MQHAFFSAAFSFVFSRGRSKGGGGCFNWNWNCPGIRGGLRAHSVQFSLYNCFKVIFVSIVCTQRQRPTMGTKSKRAQSEMQKIYWQTIYLRAEQSERNKSKMWQIICPKLRQVAPRYQSNSQYLRTRSPDRPIDLLSWPGVCCELS